MHVWLDAFGGENKMNFFVGIAALIWSIWKARNLACFQHVWPNDPSVLMFRMSHWINDGSCLQVKEDAKVELQRGAKPLDRVASDLFQSRRGWATWVPRLEDG